MGVFAEFERSMIQGTSRAGLARARSEGKQLGRPRIAPELEKRILAALNKPGRTEGVRKIAERFNVDPSTVLGSATLSTSRQATPRKMMTQIRGLLKRGVSPGGVLRRFPRPTLN